MVAESAAGARRRSIYMQQRRTQVLGMLDVFDAPAMVFSCTARPTTTVPLQSLNLLNSEFVRARAVGLAKRVPPGDDPLSAVTRAYRLVAGRSPTQIERDVSLEFLAEQPRRYPEAPNAAEKSWTDFCHNAPGEQCVPVRGVVTMRSMMSLHAIAARFSRHIRPASVRLRSRICSMRKTRELATTLHSAGHDRRTIHQLRTL